MDKKNRPSKLSKDK